MNAKEKTPGRGHIRNTTSIAGWLVVIAVIIVAVGALALRNPRTEVTPPRVEEDGGSMTNNSDVKWYSYETVKAYPHDTGAFTQGLVWRNGRLYEGTGQRGASSLRRVKLETGVVERKIDLAAELFGEGITVWDNSVIQITWQDELALVHDVETFDLRNQFTYEGEGWGITHDHARLIMSDGTSTLTFRNPTTFVETDNVEVLLNGRPLGGLNELEYIKGEVWANVWPTDQIVRINPDTGEVAGVIDLTGILSKADRRGHRVDVLNGIAHDEENDRLFVTGKNWPKLFEIRVIER